MLRRPFSHRRGCRCHRHHRRSYRSQRRQHSFRKTMCTRRVFLRKWYSNLSLLLNVRWQFEFLSFWQHQCACLSGCLHVVMNGIAFLYIYTNHVRSPNIRCFSVGSRVWGKVVPREVQNFNGTSFSDAFLHHADNFRLSIAFHGECGYRWSVFTIHHIQ